MEPQERQIGANRYRVHPLGFKAGRRALLRFTKVAGPTLAELAQLGAGSKKLLDLNVAGPLASFAERLTDADLDYFEEVFTPKTEVLRDGADGFVLLADVKELLWAQNYGEFLRWLMFCAEVNFGGFFAAARSAAPGPTTTATGS